MNPVPKDPIKFALTIAKLLFLKEVKEKMFYLTRKKKTTIITTTQTRTTTIKSLNNLIIVRRKITGANIVPSYIHKSQILTIIYKKRKIIFSLALSGLK